MILVDSHIVIWLMTVPRRISNAAAEAIAKTGTTGQRPAVSVASIFEVTYAWRHGRIDLLVEEEMLLHLMREQFDLIPVTETIAFEAAALSDSFHGDPIDRMIVATARVEGRTLLTADRRILASGVCRTLW